MPIMQMRNDSLGRGERGWLIMGLNIAATFEYRGGEAFFLIRDMNELTQTNRDREKVEGGCLFGLQLSSGNVII
jgi:hypothetical protein